MAKLNQIIAIDKGIKSRNYSAIGDINKALQKPDLFNGLTKTYEKKDADDADLPTEKKRVQYTTTELLRTVARESTEMMNVTARRDWTNASARADILVDGAVVLAAVPVTNLLYLEKQVTDLLTLAGNLPTLDEAEEWTHDPNSGLFRSEATRTHRTKKVAKPIVLYPATAEHPAQTQMVGEDIIAGYWAQVKFSGAMPKPKKELLIARVTKLLNGVKEARELANSVDETKSPNVGEAIFSYLFEDVVG